MNSRERVKAVIERTEADRYPFNFWMERDRLAELDEKYAGDYRLNHCCADVKETFIFYDFNCGLKPQYRPVGTLSWQVAPTLENMEDVYNLQFPKIDGNESVIYSDIVDKRQKFPDVCLLAMTLTPLDNFFNLRTMDLAMYDFYDYEKECEYIINQYGKILLKLVQKLENYDVDVLYLGGDICSKTGPMMSLDMLRKYCFEPMKPAIDEAHRQGLKVFFHTDGAVMDIIPLVLEYNIDAINPLQPHLNDAAEFKKKYGDKLAVYGGLDNCYKIPNGTAEDVKDHVKNVIDVLGKGGGLVISCHDIPNNTPIENIEAIGETIRAYPYKK